MQQRKIEQSIIKCLLLVSLFSFSSFSLFAGNNGEADVIKALEDDNTTLAKEVFSRFNESQKSTLTGQILKSRILFREDKTEESYEVLAQLRRVKKLS